MGALISRAIAAKLVIGAVATAIALALSSCAPARLIIECASGALGCK